jgi:hypothetical protein
VWVHQVLYTLHKYTVSSPIIVCNEWMSE